MNILLSAGFEMCRLSHLNPLDDVENLEFDSLRHSAVLSWVDGRAEIQCQDIINFR